MTSSSEKSNVAPADPKKVAEMLSQLLAAWQGMRPQKDKGNGCPAD